MKGLEGAKRGRADTNWEAGSQVFPSFQGPSQGLFVCLFVCLAGVTVWRIEGEKVARQHSDLFRPMPWLGDGQHGGSKVAPAKPTTGKGMGKTGATWAQRNGAVSEPRLL
jgi:hypothetical protein